VSWNLMQCATEQRVMSCYPVRKLEKYEQLLIVIGIDTRGTRWRSWLRQCDTRPKVVVSIPYRVIVIFYSPNPSGLAMS
jgi:hypothetical protein